MRSVRLAGILRTGEVTESLGKLNILEEVGVLEQEELKGLEELEESETWQSDVLEPLLATVERRDSISWSVISLINSAEPNPALRGIIESDRTFQKRI